MTYLPAASGSPASCWRPRRRRVPTPGFASRGTDEYRNPVEFFRRTYLTESLKAMLVGAVRRLAGQGGDPVVQLQTNFGGGKTHSMLFHPAHGDQAG